MQGAASLGQRPRSRVNGEFCNAEFNVLVGRHHVVECTGAVDYHIWTKPFYHQVSSSQPEVSHCGEPSTKLTSAAPLLPYSLLVVRLLASFLAFVPVVAPSLLSPVNAMVRRFVVRDTELVMVPTTKYRSLLYVVLSCNSSNYRAALLLGLAVIR